MMIDLMLASINFHPTYAGPAIRFRRYEPGFYQRGVRMRVFSGISSSEESRPVSAGEQQPSILLNERIEVEQVGIPSQPDWRRYYVYDEALIATCLVRPPQIIHFLSLSLYSMIHSRRYRKLGVPLIYTHTMSSERSKNTLKKIYQSILWKLPYQFMDCIVTSSDLMRRQLLDIGVTTRIEVIQNGVDVTSFKPLTNEEDKRVIRQELGLPVSGQMVLFVGSLSHRKGIDLLLEGWQAVVSSQRSAFLVLVGPKYEDIRPQNAKSTSEAKLQALLSKLHSNRSVILTGTVSKVNKYLQAADLLVFPSRREGMPNVIPEAYASGLPVLMCPFFGLPEEFGKSGEHYWLVKHQSADIAAAIIHLLRNPEIRHYLQENAFKLARAKMNVEHSLNQYVDLYLDMLNSGCLKT